MEADPIRDLIAGLPTFRTDYVDRRRYVAIRLRDVPSEHADAVAAWVEAHGGYRDRTPPPRGKPGLRAGGLFRRRRQPGEEFYAVPRDVLAA